MNKKKNITLMHDEVHIWSVRLSENETYTPYFTTLLSQDERKKINSFKFARDRKRYVIARGILRTLLAEYLGESPQVIEILYGLCGKPCLAEQKRLFFNLSHAENYVLYAIAEGYEVGIDLECIDAKLELEEMSRIIFSKVEFDCWDALSDKEKIMVFFKHWVEKEAFLKAKGTGWLELESTDVSAEKNELKRVQSPDEFVDNLRLNPYFFELIPGYASALFIKGPPLKPYHYIWSDNFTYNACSNLFKRND